MEEFYNEITYFLDGYKIKDNEDFLSNYLQNTYFVDFGVAEDDKNIHIYIFRVPGSTRGQVYVDSSTGKITFIEVYGDFQCTYPYSVPYDELTNMLQKFVGVDWKSLGCKERKPGE